MPLLAKVAQLRQGTGVGDWALQEFKDINREAPLAARRTGKGWVQAEEERERSDR
jgi:hypothetical protein